jgi:hypothetical protein
MPGAKSGMGFFGVLLTAMPAFFATTHACNLCWPTVKNTRPQKAKSYPPGRNIPAQALLHLAKDG